MSQEEDFEASEADENPDVVDVGDPKKVRKARKTKRTKDQLDKEDLQAVVSTAAGRRVMWRLLSQCTLYHSTIGLPDHTVRERSGMREIGLWIIEQLLIADRKSYILMRTEAENSTLEEK